MYWHLHIEKCTNTLCIYYFIRNDEHEQISMNIHNLSNWLNNDWWVYITQFVRLGTLVKLFFLIGISWWSLRRVFFHTRISQKNFFFHNQFINFSFKMFRWMVNITSWHCWYQCIMFYSNVYTIHTFIWHLSQSSIRPSIYFSSIVKSRSNPFLEPTSTKQQVKFLAQRNNGGLWWGSNPRPPHYESDVQPTAPRHRRRPNETYGHHICIQEHLTLTKIDN